MPRYDVTPVRYRMGRSILEQIEKIASRYQRTTTLNLTVFGGTAVGTSVDVGQAEELGEDASAEEVNPELEPESETFIFSYDLPVGQAAIVSVNLAPQGSFEDLWSYQITASQSGQVFLQSPSPNDGDSLSYYHFNRSGSSSSHIITIEVRGLTFEPGLGNPVPTVTATNIIDAEFRSINLTQNFTLNDETNVIYADASNGPIDLYVPTAVGRKDQRYRIKKVDATRNRVRLIPVSGQLIDDYALLDIFDQFVAVEIASNNVSWFIW